MFSEDQLLPISALQHLIFCERQCALIHVERLWEENRLTVEGRLLHNRAHEAADEHRHGVTIARGMPVRSLRLGLFGVADVVELHFEPGDGRADHSDAEPAYPSSTAQRDTPLIHHVLRGQLKQVTPIEYKRGRPKKDDSDRVQVAAQAVCLEEMLDCRVDVAHLYYGKRKRRTEVMIDESLRARLKQATSRLHQMIADRETPRAVRQPKCDSCSLINVCLPDGTLLPPVKGIAAHVSRAD